MRNAGEVALGTAALFGVTAALIVLAWRERRYPTFRLGAGRQRVVLNEVGAVALAREPEAEDRKSAQLWVTVSEPVQIEASEIEVEADEAVETDVQVEASEIEVEAVEAVEAEVQVEASEIEVEADVQVEKPTAPPAAVRTLADLSHIFADLMPTVEAVVDIRDSAPEDEAEPEDYVDIRDEVVEVTEYWSAPVVDLNDDLFAADAPQPRRFLR